jgi:uncharacterized OB-fold protein
MSSRLPAPAPVVNPETAPFWAATAEGKLLITHCDDCGQYTWYPRFFCAHCWSTNVTQTPAAGTGTIYSFAINRRGLRDYAADGVAPYVVAYVELDEGPRVLTNIVDADPESLAIGDRVSITFDDTGQGSALYRFRPAQAPPEQAAAG